MARLLLERRKGGGVKRRRPDIFVGNEAGDGDGATLSTSPHLSRAGAEVGAGAEAIAANLRGPHDDDLPFGMVALMFFRTSGGSGGPTSHRDAKRKGAGAEAEDEV